MGSCQSRYSYGVEMGCRLHCNACWGGWKGGRKKQRREAVAWDAKLGEVLSGIPGRRCGNGSSSTWSIFTQQGRKGTNQDAMLVWEDFASQPAATLCGVFDGHGPHGHLVARRVRDALPTMLASECSARKAAPRSGEMGRATVSLWKDSFVVACHLMDEELRAHPAIDCFCSGTTAVTLLLHGEDVVVANVGDSRAVLGTMTDDNTIEAIQLTVDLKPNLPNEAERIKRCKGRVFSLQDEPEVARVWLPYDNSPGLAMARAFGDFCLKDFGVIAVPDITHHRITHNDRFIVLATDGIWDVLSNKEVVEAVCCAPSRATVARALVETAVAAWRLKYPTSKVDDCAVVCLFLNNYPLRLSMNGTPNKSAADPAILRTEVSTYTMKDKCAPSYMQYEEAIATTDGEPPKFKAWKDKEEKSPRSIKEDDGEIMEVVQKWHCGRSLADCLSAAADEEWSALDGVTRVNSVLNLPRLISGKSKTWREEKKKI